MKDVVESTIHHLWVSGNPDTYCDRCGQLAREEHTGICSGPSNLRKGDWTQTFSGKAFWVADPKEKDIDIRDIAHGLSNICRFAGQSRRFYSVAEHSLLLSWVVPRQQALWALLHDAPEAYMGDIPRPVKRCIPGISELEAGVMSCVARRFGLEGTEVPDFVHFQDTNILMNEAAVLLGPTPHPWNTGGVIIPGIRIACYTPEVVEGLFLYRFQELQVVQ